MVNYGEILETPPYSLGKEEKRLFLTKHLAALTRRHYENCAEYRRIIDAMQFDTGNIDSYYDIPFLPVRIFKEYDLMSIPKENVAKVVTSSGTTGQAVSRIYLDGGTAANQTKALTKIVSSYIGSKRLPMIIIDTAAVLKDRSMYSARGAGIMGFSIFSKDRIFALDEDMELNLDGICRFLSEHEGERILLFGFTYMIWRHFCEKLIKEKRKLNIADGILIHGGGWKKLADREVSPGKFKETVHEVCGITGVHDYYGMAEQTGAIYMECEHGRLHASIFSDVIIRRAYDFSIAGIGEKGIIEVVSVLPWSYPGHALLTEDEGIILGEDDCPCGRKGKYFKVAGRLKSAEIRGCGDTYADRAR
jgi:phenylacetate-coenzyme A ligase PaaK-like adenylate-forming protein